MGKTVEVTLGRPLGSRNAGEKVSVDATKAEMLRRHGYLDVPRAVSLDLKDSALNSIPSFSGVVRKEVGEDWTAGNGEKGEEE